MVHNLIKLNAANGKKYISNLIETGIIHTGTGSSSRAPKMYYRRRCCRRTHRIIGILCQKLRAFTWAIHRPHTHSYIYIDAFDIFLFRLLCSLPNINIERLMAICVWVCRVGVLVHWHWRCLSVASDVQVCIERHSCVVCALVKWTTYRNYNMHVYVCALCLYMFANVYGMWYIYMYICEMVCIIIVINHLDR